MYDRRFVVPSVGNSSLFTVWNLKNKMFSLINRIDINHFTPKWKHPYGLCLQLIWLSQPPRVHQAGYKKEKEKKRKKKIPVLSVSAILVQFPGIAAYVSF